MSGISPDARALNRCPGQSPIRGLALMKMVSTTADHGDDLAAGKLNGCGLGDMAPIDRTQRYRLAPVEGLRHGIGLHRRCGSRGGRP